MEDSGTNDLFVFILIVSYLKRKGKVCSFEEIDSKFHLYQRQSLLMYDNNQKLFLAKTFGDYESQLLTQEDVDVILTGMFKISFDDVLAVKDYLKNKTILS